MGPKMQPLSLMPAELRRQIGVVLCDIDDTLTSDGRLPAISYGAMEALQQAGLRVLPVTGRPAGWCDLIARFWPVDGVVGENGAFYYRYDRPAKRMVRRYWADAAARAADRQKLEVLEAHILATVPGSAVASDQAYREADLAIDHCEDVAPLADAQVAEIVRLFEAAGARAKVSSIHVNGWFGDYDKLAMTLRLLAEAFGLDRAVAAERALFVGDSPNDAPLFAFFPAAVGVANVRAFAGRLEAEPAYVTEQPGAAGFAELAEALLGAR